MHSLYFYFIVYIATTHTETVKEDVPHELFFFFLIMCNCGHCGVASVDVFITV